MKITIEDEGKILQEVECIGIFGSLISSESYSEMLMVNGKVSRKCVATSLARLSAISLNKLSGNDEMTENLLRIMFMREFGERTYKKDDKEKIEKSSHIEELKRTIDEILKEIRGM